MVVKFPAMTAWQGPVRDWVLGGRGRVGVVKSRRQCGKSTLASVLLCCSVLGGGISLYLAPTLKQCGLLYRKMERTYRACGLLKGSNGKDLVLTFVGGGEVHFRSTQQGESVRGEVCTGLLVVDEAAYCDDDVVQSLLPSLNVHRANMLIISTPLLTEGWFYEMWEYGLSGLDAGCRSFDWSKYSMDSFLSPAMRERYRMSMSPQKYRTEVEGEFLEGDGLLFKGLDSVLVPSGGVVDGGYHHLGIDWGNGVDGDYTVVVDFGSDGVMRGMWRTNAKSPSDQLQWVSRIFAECGRGLRTVVAETNSMGTVYVDLLRKDLRRYGGCRLTEFWTSNNSKQDLVSDMQFAIESGICGLWDDVDLKREFRCFTATLNARSKTWSYGGARGVHDDIVMATMFAWHGFRGTKGSCRIVLS